MRKNANLTRSIFIQFVVVLATITVVDIVSYNFFNKEIRAFFPGYGFNAAVMAHGYPRYHFKQDDELGFDINPNFKTSTYVKPLEYGEYEVWGNSFGCFDDEWDQRDLAGGIYLAGDSFTWGFSSFETKFGTLLEQEIQKPVYACGVTHTGQWHQYKKFKKLFRRGLRPSIVIVNMTSNDLDNDFHFPHTSIIDGYLIDNIKICVTDHSGRYSLDDFSLETLSDEELSSDLERSFDNVSYKALLKQYSLTANVISVITRSLRGKIAEFKSESSVSCSTNVYSIGIKLTIDGTDYESSRFTKSNREAIKEWIEDSDKNNYELVFSFIPDKPAHEDDRSKHYSGKKEYISGLGGNFIDFASFLQSWDKQARSSLYYKVDGHFNEDGNSAYADFLRKSLNRFNVKEQNQ